MRISTGHAVLSVIVALVILAVGFLLGASHTFKSAPTADKTSFQQDMDAYCRTRLTENLSKLSPEYKNELTEKTFFSRKLHTCVEVEVTSDPKNAGAMNYVVSDLTYGFVAAPKWHHSESPLHVYQTDIRDYHHLSAEGYWRPVSSDPSQQSVADSNAVKLSCNYTEARGADSDSNTCTETQGYTQFASIHTDMQTYHIASWSRDEVIATDAERGLAGSTTTTLLIHPQANEVEIVDRTRMDEKQPDFSKDMAGKSFGDHYELHGGCTCSILKECSFSATRTGW